MTRGKINLYHCGQCGGTITTLDLDEGVTPMMLRCRATPGCDGSMQSAMYGVDQTLTPGWEWYRPDALPDDPAQRDYIERGGLLLRKRDPKTPALPTTERLALALEAANDPALAPIIQRARAGHYDDFKTTIATPMIQLVLDLRALGHPELAQRAVNGEWDATPQEAQEWFDREGYKLIRGFFKKPGKPKRRKGSYK